MAVFALPGVGDTPVLSLPSALVVAVLGSVAQQVADAQRGAAVRPRATERAELELTAARRLWESLRALGHYETELGRGAEEAVRRLERALALSRAQDAIAARFASLRELGPGDSASAEAPGLLGVLRTPDVFIARLEWTLRDLGVRELSAHAVRSALIHVFAADDSLQHLARIGHELASARARLQVEAEPSWPRLPRARELLVALHAAEGSERRAAISDPSGLLAWADGVRYLPSALIGLDVLRAAIEEVAGRTLAELLAPPGVRTEDLTRQNVARALRWAMTTLAGEWERPGFEVRVCSLAQAAVLPTQLRARDPARFVRSEEAFALALQRLKHELGFYREPQDTPARVRDALERFVLGLERDGASPARSGPRGLCP